ncbi:flagellar basal body rod protein FlgB [Helicobacter cholecystus]|uniref:Flagellar basal body rod protein FlgB n=1 Tax=Helicobacter cholecystus TaxID=45498 RepID=A0A3D8IX90_9HELI|nr:flagellar basal body rod protein FlgB [Helicobacter cholecystus]RDU69224.1 flagellar basal body rod protein FlgB [Helicobacter cholecystus]VEJ24299.1 flagellar basal-body rod protein FlgB [Helicobacter cholecystus]
MSFIEVSPVYKYAHKALDYRSIRQDLISGNIANVDTPFYKPRDINFESYLSEAMNEEFGKNRSFELKMAQTSSKHLNSLQEGNKGGMIFFRDGHMARNDGNSVDLDVETSEMGKNSVMYQALVASLKKHKGIFAYALESSKNI